MARDALRLSAVASPIDGVLAALEAKPGELWSPGPQPMARVVDQSTVKVRVSLPASRLGSVSTGLHAEVEVDAFPGRRFEARLVRIDPVADTRSRGFGLEALAANPEGLLRAGMPARLYLALEASAGALRIPRAALLEGSSGASVFLALGGRASRREVRPGLADPQWVEILEGLQPGDEVVVEGAQGLVPGAPIAPSPWQPGPDRQATAEPAP